MKITLKDVKKIKENNAEILESNPDVLCAFECMEKEIAKTKEDRKVLLILKKYGLGKCYTAVTYVNKIGYKVYSKTFSNAISEEEVNILLKNF